MKNSAIIKILARTINNASQINLMKVFENFGGNFLKLISSNLAKKNFQTQNDAQDKWRVEV